MFPHSSGGQKSEIQPLVGPNSLQGSRGQTFRASSSFWRPWHSLARSLQPLPLSSHGPFLFSLPLYVKSPSPFSDKDTSHWMQSRLNPGWRHPRSLTSLHPQRPYFLIRSHSQVPGSKTWAYLLGGQNSNHYNNVIPNNLLDLWILDLLYYFLFISILLSHSPPLKRRSMTGISVRLAMRCRYHLGWDTKCCVTLNSGKPHFFALKMRSYTWSLHVLCVQTFPPSIVASRLYSWLCSLFLGHADFSGLWFSCFQIPASFSGSVGKGAGSSLT